MRTRIAIPVALYPVRYETRRGRPYSGFERLVLDAVADGAGDIGELEELFGVHRRIVVECVVTLVQAGWVAVAADGALVATAAGREAAHIGGIPRTTTRSASWWPCIEIRRDLHESWARREVRRRDARSEDPPTKPRAA